MQLIDSHAPGGVCRPAVAAARNPSATANQLIQHCMLMSWRKKHHPASQRCLYTHGSWGRWGGSSISDWKHAAAQCNALAPVAISYTILTTIHEDSAGPCHTVFRWSCQRGAARVCTMLQQSNGASGQYLRLETPGTPRLMQRGGDGERTRCTRCAHTRLRCGALMRRIVSCLCGDGRPALPESR